MSSSSPEQLESYLGGRWVKGSSVETALVDPVQGTTLATAGAGGIDFKAAVEFARVRGQANLSGLSYAARAKLLNAVADVLIANREKYEAIAIANSGNTRIDAAIDIDGGIGTLKYYARLGGTLGETRTMLAEKSVRLGKAENYQGIHLLTPRRGVAVHINAFNFPSWGLWEKAAVALLSGMPVVAKPASATALLSHAMVRDVVEKQVLPEGALSLVVGSLRDMLDHLTADDVVAFTGSAHTAALVKGHRNVVARNVTVNIEADSLNAALLAPGSAPGTAMFDALVREVVREMTVKAGQKCTAIRRVFVAAEQADQVVEAISAMLSSIAVGDPRREDVRMGPVVTRAQQQIAFEGIRQLAGEAAVVCGGAQPRAIEGIDGEKSAFVFPTLLRAPDGERARVAHEIEVFGPVATVLPYRNEAEAFTLVGRGGGSLVASVFAEDSGFLSRAVNAIAPAHGRILAVDPAIASAHAGHGIVLPQSNHGGPGRAGNGEELGGLNGLKLYHQRVAIQGSSDFLGKLQAEAAPLN